MRRTSGAKGFSTAPALDPMVQPVSRSAWQLRHRRRSVSVSANAEQVHGVSAALLNLELPAPSDDDCAT